MRTKARATIARHRKRGTSKTDSSTATRPHQVQDPGAVVRHSKEARRKRDDEGRTFQDQSP